MNKQQPLLQINNLSLAYGAKEILKSVQLTVCPVLRAPGERSWASSAAPAAAKALY